LNISRSKNRKIIDKSENYRKHRKLEKLISLNIPRSKIENKRKLSKTSKIIENIENFENIENSKINFLYEKIVNYRKLISLDIAISKNQKIIENIENSKN